MIRAEGGTGLSAVSGGLCIFEEKSCERDRGIIRERGEFFFPFCNRIASPVDVIAAVKQVGEAGINFRWRDGGKRGVGGDGSDAGRGGEILCNAFSCAAAENENFESGIAAEAVGSMEASGGFSGGEEAGNSGFAAVIDANSSECGMGAGANSEREFGK